MNYVSMTMKRLGYKKLIFNFIYIFDIYLRKTNVFKQSIFILEDLQPMYLQHCFLQIFYKEDGDGQAVNSH